MKNLYDAIQAPCVIDSGTSTVSRLGSASANSANLQTNYRGPLLLTEMRITLQCAAPGSGSARTVDIRGYVKARVRMGIHPLTDGFVPVSLLGSATPSGLVSLTTNGIFSGLIGFGTDEVTQREVDSNCWNYSSWRFRRPFYVPPNSSFVVDYYMDDLPHISDSFPTSAIMSTAFFGYYLKPDACVQKSIIPYATGWNASRALSYTTKPLMAPDITFRNTFNTDLHVNRFIGRLQTIPNTDVFATVEQTEKTLGSQELIVNNQAPTGVVSASAASIKMQTGYADQCIRDWTPWWVAFDPQTFSWEVDCPLVPNDYYSFWMQGNTWLGMQADREETVQ